MTSVEANRPPTLLFSSTPLTIDRVGMRSANTRLPGF